MLQAYDASRCSCNFSSQSIMPVVTHHFATWITCVNREATWQLLNESRPEAEHRPVTRQSWHHSTPRSSFRSLALGQKRIQGALSDSCLVYDTLLAYNTRHLGIESSRSQQAASLSWKELAACPSDLQVNSHRPSVWAGSCRSADRVA